MRRKPLRHHLLATDGKQMGRWALGIRRLPKMYGTAMCVRPPQIFRLSFGPKSFVVISDPQYARQVLLTHADKYSKGMLSEILVRGASAGP